ncbi:hypothetical protein B0F90DRAFT_827117 [Multifurca ochricompacta]|uniref:Uncharacterized protein n=1 Tax=Multifurca ochricompacta TaxID=376703 RepID=A0AAD4M1Q5_9AGAM|nr:hypothetical protein B0F90DRAFT_827117 [Multifurca ochricompacta]
MERYYSPLARSSPQSPQVLSTHTQGSIRRRSGSHKVVIPSQTVSIGSRHPRSDYFHDGAWQSAEDGHSKASTHGTVMASSSTRSASHFTTIPGRAHRTSIIFSRSSPYLQHRERSTLSRHVSSITTSTVDYKESLTLRTPVSANNSDDVVASSGPPSTSPTAGVSSSHLSGFFTSVQSLTKQLSSKTQSGLVTLRRKAISFPKPRLPTFDSTKPTSPKSRFGLDRQLTSYSSQSFLSATDKLTQKWPQPQSLRLVPPGFRADLISSDCGYLRGLRGVGVWSQRNLEAALRDSQGLGIEW